MKVGILIIGSLLWDNHNRGAWRDERLDMDSMQRATTSIRYGRISGGKRKCTYTMVFSRTAEHGTAMIVPCRYAACCTKDIFEEAARLADAEGLGSNSRWASFGAVGAIANPQSAQAADSLRDWPRYFRDHLNGECEIMMTRPLGEGSSVNRDGFLDIDWPRTRDSNAPSDCDILLATANAPTLEVDGSYPSATQVADNFLRQKYTDYFVKNVLHGIITADDGAIWRRVSLLEPAWLEKDEKRRVFEALSKK